MTPNQEPEEWKVQRVPSHTTMIITGSAGCRLKVSSSSTLGKIAPTLSRANLISQGTKQEDYTYVGSPGTDVGHLGDAWIVKPPDVEVVRQSREGDGEIRNRDVKDTTEESAQIG